MSKNTYTTVSLQDSSTFSSIAKSNLVDRISPSSKMQALKEEAMKRRFNELATMSQKSFSDSETYYIKDISDLMNVDNEHDFLPASIFEARAEQLLSLLGLEIQIIKSSEISILSRDLWRKYIQCFYPIVVFVPLGSPLRRMQINNNNLKILHIHTLISQRDYGRNFITA